MKPQTYTVAQIERAMHECCQMPGISIWQHGESVREYFDDLIGHLSGIPLSRGQSCGKPLAKEWRLPDWIGDPRLLDRLLPIETLRTYQLWHDCGKPFCRVVDADGRQHFPDHAAISERIWLQAGGEPQVGRLIGMDMDVHTMRAENAGEFAQRPEACSLLLTGLAEINSNAAMFGGIESTSFKIKFKRLNKIGKRILENLDG